LYGRKNEHATAEFLKRLCFALRCFCLCFCFCFCFGFCFALLLCWAFSFAFCFALPLLMLLLMLLLLLCFATSRYYYYYYYYYYYFKILRKTRDMTIGVILLFAFATARCDKSHERRTVSPTASLCSSHVCQPSEG
jgi:hypothetical protein